MNTVRLDYLAGRLAPFRAVIATERNNGAVYQVTFECGHHTGIVPHFHVKIGETMPCRACGRLAALKLPEFSNQERD